MPNPVPRPSLVTRLLGGWRSSSHPRLPVITHLADFTELPFMCNGAATGYQCQHYWPVVWGEPSVKTADDSQRSRRQRLCTVTGDGDDLGHAGKAMARWCGLYARSDRPYLAAFEEAAIKQHVNAGTSIVGDVALVEQDQLARLKDQARALVRAAAEAAEKKAAEEEAAKAAANPDPAVTITKPEEK